MIFRLFSPHGHGQCKAMRYISKHEADVYLDKEEKTQSLDWGRRKRPQLQHCLQNVTFCLHYNGANSRSCTMLWDGPIFVLLFSIPHWKSRGNVSHHKWTKIRKLTIIRNSLVVKTTSGKIHYTLKWDLQNKTWIITSSMSHLQKYMHVKWL